MKEEIDAYLPGDWTSVDASELIALFILTLILILAAFGDIQVKTPIIRETIVVCLTVIFGAEYMKKR